MGLTAASTRFVSEAASGGLSAVASEGTAVGSIFTSLAIIFVLGYLDLLDAADREDDLLRRTLVTVAVPLGVVFTSVVLSEIIPVL